MKKERNVLITREGSEDEQVVNVEREVPSLICSQSGEHRIDQ